MVLQFDLLLRILIPDVELPGFRYFDLEVNTLRVPLQLDTAPHGGNNRGRWCVAPHDLAEYIPGSLDGVWTNRRRSV